MIPNPERLWPDGNIQVHEQITGGTPGVLLDGSASLNVAFENALQTWNQYLGRIQFVPVRGSTVTVGDSDDVNNVFLSNTVFGTPFDSGVFVVTSRWYSTTTNRRLEHLHLHGVDHGKHPTHARRRDPNLGNHCHGQWWRLRGRVAGDNALAAGSDDVFAKLSGRP